MITTSIDQQGLREALKELKQLDENAIKDLRANLRTGLGPAATAIAGSVQVEAPLSGMNNKGRLGWSAVRNSVSFTPGKSKKSGNSFLATIKITGKSKKGGFEMAELAGSRTKGVTASGRAMIRGLNARYPMIKRGGRFTYAKFRELRPQIEKLAIKILKQTTDKVNKRLVR